MASLKLGIDKVKEFILLITSSYKLLRNLPDSAKMFKEKITLTIFYTLIVCCLVSPSNGTELKPAEKPINYIANLSPELNILINMLEASTADRERLHEIFIPVLIKYETYLTALPFLKYVNTINNNYAVGYIQPHELKFLLKNQNIRYVSLGGQLYPNNIDFTKFLSPNILENKNNININTILIGVIDHGFDLSFDFDKKFKDQIIAYWNQADIANDSKQENKGLLVFPEPSSSSVHGSVVSSIIYKIAPSASYAIADITHDQIDVINATDFISTLAREVKLPGIINLSVNTSAGPHDGTSLFDQILSSYVKKDFNIIVSAGNEGDKKRHVEFGNDDLVQNEINLKFNIDSDGVKSNLEIAFDLWFNSRITCEASISLPRSPFIFEAVSPKSGRLYKSDNTYISICNDTSNTLNGNSNVLIIVKGSNISKKLCGEWNVKLRFFGHPVFICDGWLALGPSTRGFCSNYVSAMKTISSPATALNVVSVGAFSEHENHKIFRSHGPTRDGRLKPDVFIDFKHHTSYASAIISGLLGRILTPRVSLEIDINQLLTTIAKDNEEIFLNSEIKQ